MSIANSIEEAIMKASIRSNSPETFIIGGEEIYRQTIHMADRLYLTEFNNPEIEGDAFFPLYYYEDYAYIYMERHEDHVFKILSKTPFGVKVGGKEWSLIPKRPT